MKRHLKSKHPEVGVEEGMSKMKTRKLTSAEEKEEEQRARRKKQRKEAKEENQIKKDKKKQQKRTHKKEGVERQRKDMSKRERGKGKGNGNGKEKEKVRREEGADQQVITAKPMEQTSVQTAHVKSEEEDRGAIGTAQNSKYNGMGKNKEKEKEKDESKRESKEKVTAAIGSGSNSSSSSDSGKDKGKTPPRMKKPKAKKQSSNKTELRQREKARRDVALAEAENRALAPKFRFPALLWLPSRDDEEESNKMNEKEKHTTKGVAKGKDGGEGEIVNLAHVLYMCNIILQSLGKMRQANQRGQKEEMKMKKGVESSSSSGINLGGSSSSAGGRGGDGTSQLSRLRSFLTPKASEKKGDTGKKKESTGYTAVDAIQELSATMRIPWQVGCGKGRSRDCPLFAFCLHNMFFASIGLSPSLQNTTPSHPSHEIIAPPPRLLHLSVFFFSFFK